MKLHQFAERGHPNDEKTLLNLLEIEEDLPEDWFIRSDPRHFLNRTNAYGQTALYLACKNGNINMVKLLISLGCNPFIKSEIEFKNLESNLQVAARWGH